MRLGSFAAPPIDDLVDAVMHGSDARLYDMFQAVGAKAPIIQWSPATTDLTNPMILDFANSCGQIGDPQQPIAEADFALSKFERHLPWMMVLEVEKEGEAFRYSHYGEGIANVRGLSMLGQTSADFGGHIGLFFTAVYGAILCRRKWLLTEHVAPKEIFARTWERLMAPVINPEGKVTRIVAMNVPDNELSAGLEIIPDPVMVLDGDQIVRYANAAARRMFDRSQFPSQDLSLFDYSGIDLDIGQSPSELVRKRAVHDRLCLATRDNMLRDFLVTISGSRIWDHDFYVITLRMDIRPA